MSNLAYLILDALLIVIVFSISWFALKWIFSIFNATHKATKHSFSLLSKISGQRDRVVFINQTDRTKSSNIQNNKKHTSATIAETIPLSDFEDTKDWSLYDAPTFLRNGIVIH